MSAPTEYTQFGPDTPISELPANLRACLPPNAPSGKCDATIGSLESGQGYCSQSPYDKMTYCSCVNNAIPCPMVAAAACANSAFAYSTTEMQAPDGQAYAACKGQPICVNIVEVGGSQNVVTGITQQCGVIQNVQNIISASPTLAAVAFILVIMLIVMMAMRVEDDGRFPPPPPPGIFGVSVMGPPEFTM